MSRLADMLHALQGNSPEFQMLAVREFVASTPTLTMYAQKSQLDLYRAGHVVRLELYAAKVFPFLEPVEVSL
jgi:hypothetical protein